MNDKSAQALRQLLSELENMRRKAIATFLLRAIGWGIFTGVLVVLARYARADTSKELSDAVVCILTATFPFAYHHVKFVFSDYRKYFESTLIGGLTKVLSPNLNFNPDQGMTISHIAESRLFPEYRSFSQVGSCDLVHGQINGIPIAFSFLQTFVRFGKGHHRKWSGVLFRCPLSKTANSLTLALPDKAEKNLGWFGQSLQKLNAELFSHDMTLVKLEDIEFEKLFVVYGKDQIEARRMLTPAIMQRIKNYAKKTHTIPSLSFCENTFYLALPMEAPVFTPPLYRPISDNDLNSYMAHLKLFAGIVEDLKLQSQLVQTSDLNLSMRAFV